jgi:hypothetical protein
MSTFPTENTAEAAYIMHRHFKDTGKVLDCQVKNNGKDEPMTIILGNGSENNAGQYAMEWPDSDNFKFHANEEWLKIKIKNIRGIR